MKCSDKEYYWLAGYTREPEEPNGYNRFVAKSLHLALQTEDGRMEALNSNYGVLFAKADYTATAAGATKLLQAPHLFRLSRGGFGIVAEPLDHNGELDSSDELLYIETGDFVHYKEMGRIKKSAAIEFIKHHDPETADLSEQLSIYGAAEARFILLTKQEAVYLRHKLGRVSNLSVDDLTITMQVGGQFPNCSSLRATARYSDGSVAYKRITVDPNDVSSLVRSTPGLYYIPAKVVRNRFPYPMMMTRPDPFVLYYRARYYFISTDDDGQRRIYIRSADTLEGLADGQTEEVLLWDGNIPDGERMGQHWAPELHVINDQLYCFLAISVNDEWHGVQAHVALLKGDDPMDPEHWDTPKRVLNRHGEVLCDPSAQAHSLSLDMTYFEHNGRSYVCWSEPKWFDGEQERASLYIATVDPGMPWRLTSDPVRICRNEYGWDRNGGIASGVSEGAFVMKRGDRLYMVFSGSNVGPYYTVGLMELHASDDPMNPDAWKKSNYPIMHSLGLPGQYGPGHNMFVQDKYGDWFNVYHACSAEGGFRHATMRPMHFRFDGSPILDMNNEEELLPAFEQMTITVKIEPGWHL